MSFQSTQYGRTRSPRPALQARDIPRKRRKPDDGPAGQGQAGGPPREKLEREAPAPDISVHPFGRTPSLGRRSDRTGPGAGLSSMGWAASGSPPSPPRSPRG